MTDQPASPKANSLISKVLRVVVTLVALAYVVSQITWHDQLRLPSGEVAYGWEVEENGSPMLRTSDGKLYPIPPATNDSTVAHPYMPGFLSLLSGIDIALLLFVFALYPITIVISGMRWKTLLATHGINPTLGTVVRLTWMGLFANNVFIGANGGDLLKAWSISRRTPGLRITAAMTVLLDRIIGLFSFMLIGGVSIFFVSDHPALVAPSQMVMVMLGSVVVGGSLYFSERFRNLVRFPQLLQRLPFSSKLVKLDQSVFHFRQHPGVLGQCIGYSMVIQLVSVACIWGIARSLGLSIAMSYFLVFLPLIFTAGAVAPSIAGLGVLEGLFQQFFSLPGVGATPSSAVALCILFRIMALVTSLPGAAPAYREMSFSPDATIPIEVPETETTRQAA